MKGNMRPSRGGMMKDMKRNPSAKMGSKPVGNKTRPGMAKGRTGGTPVKEKGSAIQPVVRPGAKAYKKGGKACSDKKKYAKGGKVRGTGCATKGTKFSGTF
ncbi:MAG: hypothetical protein V2J13_10690 [Cycloclasticus sp.]|jgi:hypothetical protein|nr:hypothetical protein [Cycloclasticus sp.]